MPANPRHQVGIQGWSRSKLGSARAQLQIVLAAPTGRAAKRLAELSGHPATTVHCLLLLPRPPDHRGAFGPNPATSTSRPGCSKTADTIAQAVGIPHDSPQRVQAGIPT